MTPDLALQRTPPVARRFGGIIVHIGGPCPPSLIVRRRGCNVGKWRALFERGLLPFDERQFGEIYEFGFPATIEQIDDAERAMGSRFPEDLREMLAEFNGIWYTSKADRKHGHERDTFYLDLEEMSAKLPEYLRRSSDPLPNQVELSKIAFVCQVNGYGELYGVCLQDVAQHRRGEVVRIDHEVGELEACYPSLADLVRHGPVGD